MDWNQKTRCRRSPVPSSVEGEGRGEEGQEGEEAEQGEGGERPLIYLL